MARGSTGGLLMVGLLRRLEGALLDEFLNPGAHVERGQARPTFRQTFAAWCAVIESRQKPPAWAGAAQDPS